MNTTRTLARMTLAAALLGVSLPAQAEWPEGRPYLGLHLGATRALLGWDIGNLAYEDGMSLANNAFFHLGPRIGYQATGRFAVEVGASAMFARSIDDESALVLQYDIDALYHLTDDEEAAPFVLLGAGAYHLATGTLASDIDPIGRVGLGYRALIDPGLALRLECRYVASDGYHLLGAGNLEVRVALDWWPGVKGEPKEEAPADRDGDGLVDTMDVCPDDPGSKRNKGCPDGDRDGVLDKDDECPEQRGLRSHKGCLPDEVAAYIGAIEGIYFEVGSAAIKAESLPILDEAIGVMERFAEVKLRIEGHTDSQGEDAFNLTLSQDRANAVRTYMVDKGVAEDRLVSEGFGETKPVGDNETAEGRALNRRIEFQMID